VSRRWSTTALLRELRRRERGAGRSIITRAAAGSALASVATGDLLRTVRDRQRAIYGTDDRQDIFRVRNNSVRAAAAAVAAVVKAADLHRLRNGSFRLRTTSYRDEYALCASEPFVVQPLGCFCTAFLVAPDVVATAGHCITSQRALAGIRFVFGFRMRDDAAVQSVFAPDDVYAGAELIARREAAGGQDWAVVRLARPVAHRRPLPVRRSGKVRSGQSLFVIGHPCGLPLKYAPGASVRHNRPATYFVANLDTYGGNSGSPVFNADTGTVEGILVRGETDFVQHGDCAVSLVCPSTGCRGEDVTRSTVWVGRVPKPKRA
jgi:hypothetical protein